MDRNLKDTLVVFGLVISFGGGYFISKAETKEKVELADSLSTFADVDNKLTEMNVNNIDDKDAAMQDCINAYYKHIGDKYFQYYSNLDEADSTTAVNESDMALDNGFTVEPNGDENVLVSSVEEGSYAEEMGLMTGDIITAIDDNVMKELGYNSGVRKILGKNGSTSVLTILRNRETVQVEYVRKFEKEEKPESYKMIDNACYIDYKYCVSPTNFGVFMDAITECDDKADAYIIDLRNNGGGATYVGLNILSYFIGKQDVLHQFPYSGGEDVLSSSDSDIRTDKQVILLVNDETASCSEIITAGLKQFRDDTVIVGENTYGKGIWQEYVDMGGTAVAYMTVGKYTVGNWECYQGKGITPDITVEMDRSLIGTDDDTQLQAALGYLKNGDVD